MCEALICRLEHFARLSEADKKILDRGTLDRVSRFGPREDIIRQGDRPTAIYVVLEGWACRYKYLEDGRRQIVAFFLPGDLCDLNIFILRQMDHTIGTLTPATLGEISRATFDRMLDDHPRITQALWWDALVGMAIQREWTVNLGQRDALERIAHLLCELFVRLRTAGLARDNSFAFPITQADLGDATGLSTVHVNRTLQELRSTNLISLSGRTLKILDREGAHLDANI